MVNSPKGFGDVVSRPRAGRRRGAPDTKGEILASARTEFGERGYDGATMRSIAGRAGVDPALVHHYFGNKEKLFLAAMEIPFDPSWIVDQITAVPADQLGERMARTFFGVWGDPMRRAPALALLRSAMSHQAAARLLRQFVTRALLRRLMVSFEGLPDGALRAETAVSQLIGLAITRYVIQIEPLASASDEEVIALVAPILQQYVTPPSR